MNKVMPVKQRGITFGGMLIGAILLVLVSIFGFKLIPAYMDDAKIKNVFNDITHNPEMQKASPSEIRASYEKRASIEGIKAISPGDIEVSSDNGQLFLSASYTVKVPLSGNVSILMEFNPASAK